MKTIFAMIATAVVFQSAPAQAQNGDWTALTDGIYEVPAPKELEKFAFFPVPDLETREVAGKKAFRYTLPREVTGRPIVVEFEETMAGSQILTGKFGLMDCTGQGCAVSYGGLNLKTVEIREFLESQGHSGLELDSRLEIARLFSVRDPGGILYPPKPQPKSCKSSKAPYATGVF